MILAALFSALLLNSTFAQDTSRQFRMRLVADPQTFDWNLATTTMETPLVMNIMEGLFEFDRQMKVTPLLAKSWVVSTDGKTYTIKLKGGVLWSDGKPLEAADFVFSWKRLLNPLTAAAYAYLLFDIEGAEDFNTRKINDFTKVGIKALDSSTLQIKLRKPVSYFLQMLTFWITFPLREDIVAKHGVSWTQPGKMVVLGPFIPVSYQPQNQILLKRNEKYYGKRPAADSVLMRIINEDSTALNLFKAGQIDYVRPINFLELGALVNSPAFHNDPYFRTCFININTNRYPFNLPKVRQALAQAIDKSKIPKVMHQAVKETDSLVPAPLFVNGKSVGLSFNAAAAGALMQEVGIDPNTAPHIDLVTYASDENALLTQYLQDQLKKNMGLTVEIQMPEFKMFRTQLELGTGTLYFRCWGADYADPDSFFGVFLSSSGNNRTGWKNAKYDEVVRKAATLPNGPDRVALYAEALDILLKKEAPIVPLYHDSLTYLLSSKIKNFVINPLNYVFFRDIVFTP